MASPSMPLILALRRCHQSGLRTVSATATDLRPGQHYPRHRYKDNVDQHDDEDDNDEDGNGNDEDHVDQYDDEDENDDEDNVDQV